MSDAAISSLVTGLITIIGMVVGFLTLWVKLRYGTQMAEKAAKKAAEVEDKIDANTVLTVEAGEAASRASIKAEHAVLKAEGATIEKVGLLHDIQKHVNSGLEAAVTAAMGPLYKMVEEHGLLQEKKMQEIRETIKRLTEKATHQ